MKTKNGVSFGLISGIFWGLGLTISAYIFSIFTDLSPDVYKRQDLLIFLKYLQINSFKILCSKKPLKIQCYLTVWLTYDKI